MAISDESIIDVTPKPMHAAEAIFLPAIAKGLGTTFRHLFGNITKPGKNKDNIYVVQYPEEKRDDRPVVEGGQERSTFRGVHRLNKDEDGRVRCVACFMRAPRPAPPTASTSPPKNHLGTTGKSIPSSSISTSFAASTAACAKKRVLVMPLS